MTPFSALLFYIRPASKLWNPIKFYVIGNSRQKEAEAEIQSVSRTIMFNGMGGAEMMITTTLNSLKNTNLFQNSH